MQTLSSLRTALFATVLLGCSSSEPQPSSTIFVGALSSQASVAVVEGADGTALVYVCDGVQDSAWFFGTRSGDTISAESDDGGTVHATLAGSQISGEIERPGQAAMAFTAPRASGVAGIYLVEQTATHAQGFSATGGALDADIIGMTLAGTVQPDDGGQLALTGTVKSFGEASGVATWIVQADGRVSGKVTNTAGGGNCSIWSKIKQVMSGVDCSFF
jgi:hypothetical protein